MSALVIYPVIQTTHICTLISPDTPATVRRGGFEEPGCAQLAAGLGSGGTNLCSVLA